MNQKRSPLPLIIAIVLLIIAALLLFLGRSQSPDNPQAPLGPAKPDTPVDVLPNKPDKVNPKDKSYKGAYAAVVAPAGYKIKKAGSSAKGDIILIEGKQGSSILIRTDAARADEPVSDRAYFASLGSSVSETLFRGQPAYLITTRYKNGFVRLTYLAQADGRNYNVSIFGKRRDIRLLKSRLLATVKSLSPVGEPPQ